MKNKVVIWGTNAENEKVLIALELQADANKVQMYAVPDTDATDEFATKVLSEWRDNNAEFTFPESTVRMERELSVTESLLPEGYKAFKDDVISRTQTEWHFVVLSTKLHKAYLAELAEFREKVEALKSYDNGVFVSLRKFWDKVQEQSRERNLYRNHADSLRDNINELFETLKKVRSSANSEFMTASQQVYDDFNAKLVDIEARIQQGSGRLQQVFDELKKLQSRYRTERMNNEHRNALWDRIDGAFKAAKERQFGPGANEGSVADRHKGRLDGLLTVIKRMEEGVRRDEEELAFQSKKIATTDGQLESQLRQAKLKMVEERLRSKQERLADMNKTKLDLERQIAKVQDKEATRKRTEEARVAAKAEIAAITTKADAKRPAPAEKEATAPETAAEPTPQSEESILSAVSSVFGETFEDVVDSVKAVAQVFGEKAKDAINDAVERAGEVVADVSEILTKEPVKEETAPAADVATEVVAEAPVAEVVAAVDAVDTTEDTAAAPAADDATEEKPA